MSSTLVFTLLSLIVVSLAYPQDAEFLPSNIPKGTPNNPANDDGILIVNLRPVSSPINPLMDLFDQIFRNSFRPVRPQDPVDPLFAPFPNTPSLFDLIPLGVPSLDDLPDDYNNSTYDVKVVNGTKIETNMTVTKNKEGPHVFVQEVHIVRYSPENETDTPVLPPNTGNEGVSPVPEVNTADNEISKAEAGVVGSEYEDFGVDSQTLNRRRRWIVPKFIQKFFGFNKPEPVSPHLQSNLRKPFQSLLGDTKVNYVDIQSNTIDPDAEIIDREALRTHKLNSLASLSSGQNSDNTQFSSKSELFEHSSHPQSFSQRSPSTPLISGHTERLSHANKHLIETQEHEFNANILPKHFHRRHRISSGYRPFRGSDNRHKGYYRSQNIHRQRSNL